MAAPDPGLVADALTAMLTEPEHRSRVLEAAPAVLARYRWADAAAATLRAIEDAGAVILTIAIVAFNAREDLARVPGLTDGRAAALPARHRRRGQRLDRRRARDGRAPRSHGCG